MLFWICFPSLMLSRPSEKGKTNGTTDCERLGVVCTSLSSLALKADNRRSNKLCEYPRGTILLLKNATCWSNLPWQLHVFVSIVCRLPPSLPPHRVETVRKRLASSYQSFGTCSAGTVGKDGRPFCSCLGSGPHSKSVVKHLPLC